MHSLLSHPGPSFVVLGSHPLDLCARPGVTTDVHTPLVGICQLSPKNRPSALQVSLFGSPISGRWLVVSPSRVLSDRAWCPGGVCGAHAPGRKRALWRRGREVSLTQVPLLQAHLLVCPYANWSFLGYHKSQLAYYLLYV